MHRCLYTIAIVTALLLAGSDSALANNGFRLMLPGWPQKPGAPFMMGVTTTTTGGTIAPLSAPTTPAAGNTTGLVLTLDTTWIDARGYRPVRITVAPTAPTPADRSLRVSFRPSNQSVAVTGDIDLPAGFTSVTTTLSVPQYAPWGSVAFDVWEDGEHVRELSIPQGSFGIGWNQYSGDNASPAILVLNSKLNGNIILNALSRSGQPVLQIGPTVSVSTTAGYIRGNTPRQFQISSSNTISSMAELPDRWIDYSALDVIIASRQDLQTLVEQHPRQWTAIRRWLSAGGNLWVYGVGQVRPQLHWNQWKLDQDKPWEHLADVNRWVQFATPAVLSPWTEMQEALHGWSSPDPYAQSTYVNPFQPQYGTRSVIVTENGVTREVVTRDVPTESTPDRKDRQPFMMRPLGQGMVVAIPDGDPSNNSFFPWNMVFNNVGAERWHWSARNGVQFNGQNENYWNFLIPGVGAAPVTAFQVLITLFVLAIGPVNFYVLKRWHKLNLLLITVPASAAVVTLALLSYAVFSDGFGVRARTRSFTEIDQQTGEATCLGRITYYAGLTPSKGLSFSGNVTVYPLAEQPEMHQFDPAESRRLAWVYEGDDDRVGTQQLESGWLQSRIQTQLLSVRARKTSARLDVAPTSGRAASITNRLGSPVSVVLVRDADGEFLAARDIDADQTAELSVLSEGEVPPELFALNRNKALQPPAGVEITGSHTIFGIRRRNYGRRFNSIGGGISGIAETGMLERSIGDALEDAVGRELPKRSYLAIVERSPEFELGIDSVAEESSLHVIYGRW
jgi:hypothetical protein